MPQIIIDGRIIEAAPGKTIIEAALDNGITIPHFCWHPALTVAGNCRMCLVNVGTHKKDTDGSLMFSDDGAPVVNWFPKMQIACATPVSDGMIVDTSSEKTEGAQNAVMEFLLINHPLDCPICAALWPTSSPLRPLGPLCTLGRPTCPTFTLCARAWGVARRGGAAAVVLTAVQAVPFPRSSRGWMRGSGGWDQQGRR